jgi:hypothetical protein
MKYDMDKAIRYHKDVASIGELIGLFFAVPIYITMFTYFGVTLYGVGNLHPAETFREFDLWVEGLGNTASGFFLLCSGAIPFIAFSIMNIYFRIQAWRYGYKKWMKAFE